MLTKLKRCITLLLIIIPILAAVQTPVYASTAFDDAKAQADAFATTAKVRTAITDPKTVAANFIKAVLAFLGIIFLILILYAGFLWMTAEGSEDRVKKAKGIIQRAVIGLAVVVLAYALTNFVFDILLKTVT